MLLPDKIAIIHGGAGAIGAAMARVFAREGAAVHLMGRTLPTLEAVAQDITARGGRATVAQANALNEDTVRRATDAVAATAGRIDIVVNAIGIPHVQGPAFLDLPLDAFLTPIDGYVRSHFITAQAAARHMVKQGSGVFLSLSTPGARLSAPGFLGNGVSSAAVEAFSRILAGELGAFGIRTVCIRPDAVPEAIPTSHAGKVFSAIAAQHGTTAEGLLAERARTSTLLHRLPTLAHVAEYAAFAASDRAGAMTGAIANLSCGSLVD